MGQEGERSREGRSWRRKGVTGREGWRKGVEEDGEERLKDEDGGNTE